MELYHKQLNSVHELKKERKRLKRSIKRSKKEHAADAAHEEGSMQDMFKGLMSSKGGVDMLRLLEPLLLRVLFKRKKVVYRYKNEEPKKSFIKKALVEVLTGYAKWKGIEVVYKLIKKAADKHKEKKTAAAASASY
jgi:hypothetical protein